MNLSRELSDQELMELSQSNAARVLALQQQGVVFQGIDEHYVQTLLEQLLGESMLAVDREKHHLWLKGNLDASESQIRAARLTQGVAVGNGAPRGVRGVPGNGRPHA